MRIAAIISMAGVLGACASSPETGNFTRVDGRPVEDGQFRAIAAQCKGEGAQDAPGWVGGGVVGMGIALGSSTSKQNDIITACMARHGYITR